MSEPILFPEDMLEHLRRNYAVIDRVNPQGPTYPKICKLLDSLDQPKLKQLSEAGIKWISPLALNRIICPDRPL